MIEVWIMCKICHDVIVGDTFGELFEGFRSHLFREHGLEIFDANMIARELIRKMIYTYPDL